MSSLRRECTFARSLPPGNSGTTLWPARGRSRGTPIRRDARDPSVPGCRAVAHCSSPPRPWSPRHGRCAAVASPGTCGQTRPQFPQAADRQRHSTSRLRREVFPGQADDVDFFAGRLAGTRCRKVRGDDDAAAELAGHVGGRRLDLAGVPGRSAVRRTPALPSAIGRRRSIWAGQLPHGGCDCARRGHAAGYRCRPPGRFNS